jgi:hypothetical protein
MNQILQQACNTRCIPKPIGEIIISLLMKFQDDQRCVIKCQFHESFWFLQYVVMLNPLITQIKIKNWFVPFHVLSQQVFSIATFCLVTFLNLNFTFGCSFNFQILINVIGNYEIYTKNEDFYFGDLVLHTKIYLDNMPNNY